MTSPISPELLGALSGGGPAVPQADPEQLIRDALDQIRLALSMDGLSEQERLVMERVTTLLQGLPAGREKERQAALGSLPAMSFLARASS